MGLQKPAAGLRQPLSNAERKRGTGSYPQLLTTSVPQYRRSALVLWREAVLRPKYVNYTNLKDMKDMKDMNVTRSP